MPKEHDLPSKTGTFETVSFFFFLLLVSMLKSCCLCVTAVAVAAECVLG